MTYQGGPYRRQGDGALVVRAADTIEADGVTLTGAGLKALAEPASVTIDLAASATTDGMDITVTVVDEDGDTVAGVFDLVMHMSEAATGAGLTADSYSGNLTASVGAILGALTEKKAWVIQTAATGIFTATLVDSANPADQYVGVKKPTAPGLVVSAASGSNWQGA